MEYFLKITTRDRNLCRANGDGFVDGLRGDGGARVADGVGRVAGRGGGRVGELVGGNYSFIFLYYSSLLQL